MRKVPSCEKVDLIWVLRLWCPLYLVRRLKPAADPEMFKIFGSLQIAPELALNAPPISDQALKRHEGLPQIGTVACQVTLMACS